MVVLSVLHDIRKRLILVDVLRINEGTIRFGVNFGSLFFTETKFVRTAEYREGRAIIAIILLPKRKGVKIE